MSVDTITSLRTAVPIRSVRARSGSRSKSPAIIPEKIFDKVQAILKSRNPKMTPARSHSSPVLLSGLGRCGNPGCDGTMMLMNGKGGQYRYYSCSNVRRKKDRTCGGNNVPMQKVDNAVVEVLEQRLLDPVRLETLLAQLLERSAVPMPSASAISSRCATIAPPPKPPSSAYSNRSRQASSTPRTRISRCASRATSRDAPRS